MIRFPANSGTFARSFLGGNGDVEVTSERWRDLFDSGAQFDPDQDVFSEVSMSGGAGKQLSFGKSGGLRLSISGKGEHAIRLIWPQGPTSAEIKRNNLLPLPDGKFYANLSFDAMGYGEAAVNMPSGPVTVNVKAGAGGSVAYDRFKMYGETDTVRDVITDLVTTIALPQQVDKTEEIPAPGEVLVTRYEGYLNLSAGLSWGYRFSGSKSIDINELNLDFEYAIRLAASITVGYRLAGSFEIEARHGQFNASGEKKWARFIVRKRRQSRFQFAADFGFHGDFDLKGLPATADDFLGKLIGSNAEVVLKGLEQATTYTDIAQLEAAVTNRLSQALVDDLAMKWVDEALSNDNIVAVLARVEGAVKAYDALDDRVIHLYEDVLDNLPGLDRVNEALDVLASLQDSGGLQNLIARTADSAAEKQAWAIIQRFWGNRIHDVLLGNEAVREVSGFAARARDVLSGDAAQDLRDLIGALKRASKLDPLFKRLREFDTPAELRAQADQRLKGLVERVVGKAFDQIKDSDLGNQLKKLHEALTRIEDFKNNTYEKLLTYAAKQSFSAELAYSYSRLRTRDALLDVEINLEHADGPRLADEASHGNFAALLANYDSAVVKVHSGLLTHRLTKTAELRVNLFGWGYSSLTEIVSDTRHSIETHAGGLIHVYTTEAGVRQRRAAGREGSQEVVTTNFLFRAVSEKLQESQGSSAVSPETKKFLADTLRDMNVQYDLTVEDQKTKFAELRRYADFANFIGLLPDTDGYLEQLESEFPRGLGRVKVQYVVRYDYDAVSKVFDLEADALILRARMAMRQFVAAKYTGMRQRNWFRPLGFAYLQGSGYRTHMLPKFFNETFPVSAVLPEGPRNLRRMTREALRLLYRSEKKYLRRLKSLDETIGELNDGEAVPVADLEEAVREFVAAAPKVDRFRDNTFFAIFDDLIRHGSGGVRGGRSAMVLEITPPVADGDEEQTVTKYLMSGRKQPGSEDFDSDEFDGEVPTDEPPAGLASAAGAGPPAS